MEIPPLPPTTILLVEVGSTAHGTGIPDGEDQDETAIVVEPTDQVLGLELQAIGELFIGRHFIPRYRGYMQSQAERLLGIRCGRHGRRGGGQREELVGAFGYDTKYAMHCARLGFQGLELLQTGRINLPMQGEPAEWLRSVRRGEVTFEDWWDRSLRLDAELEALSHDEALPPGPDRKAITSWSVKTHLQMWDRTAAG